MNAFDSEKEKEYRKLTDNGNIVIEYGAHDLMIEKDIVTEDITPVNPESLSD